MTQPLNRFVSNADTLDRLKAHAAKLSRLQAHVAEALPPYLAGLCHVANLKDGVLVIHAHNGAIAAKLRQASPRLLSALAAQGVLLSSIKVATRPPTSVPPQREPTLRDVSHSTCDSLHTLAEELPEDDPLRKALERFVQHSRTRDD